MEIQREKSFASRQQLTLARDCFRVLGNVPEQILVEAYTNAEIFKKCFEAASVSNPNEMQQKAKDLANASMDVSIKYPIQPLYMPKNLLMLCIVSDA